MQIKVLIEELQKQDPEGIAYLVDSEYGTHCVMGVEVWDGKVFIK